MTRIYLVRHCEAIGNVIRIFQGTTDLDISQLGEKQLGFLKKRFENIELDAVFSSPLIRTQKTAKAIIGDRKLPLKINDGLIELHGGVVEGKPVIEAFNSIPGLADTWNNHPQDFAPQNGEKMSHAYERIWETVLTLAKENPNKNIACATHGGVLRCLTCRILHNDITKLKDTDWSENTAVTLLEFDESLNPRILLLNDVSHLPKEFINKRSKISSFLKGENQ